MADRVTDVRRRIVCATFLLVLARCPIDVVRSQERQPTGAVATPSRSQTDPGVETAPELERQRATLMAVREELARQRETIERLTLDRDSIRTETQNQVSLIFKRRSRLRNVRATCKVMGVVGKAVTSLHGSTTACGSGTKPLSSIANPAIYAARRKPEAKSPTTLPAPSQRRGNLKRLLMNWNR
jgi:hypothetical protein